MNFGEFLAREGEVVSCGHDRFGCCCYGTGLDLRQGKEAESLVRMLLRSEQATSGLDQCSEV